MDRQITMLYSNVTEPHYVHDGGIAMTRTVPIKHSLKRLSRQNLEIKGIFFLHF